MQPDMPAYIPKLHDWLWPLMSDPMSTSSAPAPQKRHEMASAFGSNYAMARPKMA